MLNYSDKYNSLYRKLHKKLKKKVVWVKEKEPNLKKFMAKICIIGQNYEIRHFRMNEVLTSCDKYKRSTLPKWSYRVGFWGASKRLYFPGTAIFKQLHRFYLVWNYNKRKQQFHEKRFLQPTFGEESMSLFFLKMFFFLEWTLLLKCHPPFVGVIPAIHRVHFAF